MNITLLLYSQEDRAPTRVGNCFPSAGRPARHLRRESATAIRHPSPHTLSSKPKSKHKDDLNDGTFANMTPLHLSVLALSY